MDGGEGTGGRNCSRDGLSQGGVAYQLTLVASCSLLRGLAELGTRGLKIGRGTRHECSLNAPNLYLC